MQGISVICIVLKCVCSLFLYKFTAAPKWYRQLSGILHFVGETGNADDIGRDGME
jgi:hypothetical protein